MEVAAAVSAAVLAALAAAAAAAAGPVEIFNKIFRMNKMAKIPDKPQDVFVPLDSRLYLKVFGKEFVSLILYGSAAGGSYIKGEIGY